MTGPDGKSRSPWQRDVDAESTDRSVPQAEATTITEVLQADLDDLADGLGGDRFLAPSIAMLRRDLRLAVRSCLGFTMTFTTQHSRVSIALNVVDMILDSDAVADHLSIPLPITPDGATVSLTVYAARPHALDSLREDFGYALDIPAATLTMPPPPHSPINPGISGLTDHSIVHQAIGFLLSTGHTYDTAGVELIRRGHTTPGGIPGAARTLLSARTGLTSPH